ncbi:MAG TPA: CAP domain-containing protein [Candidatus Paceibacterota bacterium]|nr:CAP domain-containing protein [Candidatus Paceibacterota bacterium]
MLDLMRKHIKNYLIPHAGNNNQPHMLRGLGALMLGGLILLVFGFFAFQGLVGIRSAHYTASVLPIVLVNITNEDRGAEGLAQLSVNPVLEEAARMKAEHMAEHSYFAHISPDGLDPWYWFYRAGYVFTEAGENLAVNFTDSEDVVQAWMDSPGHRANILNGKFSEIGIAAVRGEYRGKKTIFVVQMFGTPAKVASAAAPAPVVVPVAPEAPAQAEPVVAGAATETAPPPVATIVEYAPPEPPTKLVKEEMTAYVEGAIQETPPEHVSKLERVGPLESMVARPRAVVSWIYLLIGLLVSFVLLLMVLKQVHHDHPRSIGYGCALLALIVLLSYFNWLLLSADLIIV